MVIPSHIASFCYSSTVLCKADCKLWRLSCNFIQLHFTPFLLGPNIVRSILWQQCFIQQLWKCGSEKCFIARRISTILHSITLYPGKDPVPILQEAGWAPGPVWTGGKSHPDQDSIPDRPARSTVSIPTELPAPPPTHTHIYILLRRRDLLNVLRSQLCPFNTTHEPSSFLDV